MTDTTLSLDDLLNTVERTAVERAITQSTHILSEAPQRLQEKARTLGFTLNRHVQPTPPARGKRDLYDVVRMIRACVQRIQEAESECPTKAAYQEAVKAEHEAYLQWQARKNSADAKKLKDAYEDAKAQRITIGGQIIGTQSTVRRMNALIAGEVLGVNNGH